MIARFTQEDVYRGDGLNLYVYVVNNPLLWIDPSGYAKKCSNENKFKKDDNLPPGMRQRLENELGKYRDELNNEINKNPNLSIKQKNKKKIKNNTRTFAIGLIDDIESLQGQIFKNASRKILPLANMDYLDNDIRYKDRTIRSPYSDAQYIDHAEEGVMASFEKALKDNNMAPQDVNGTFYMIQSNGGGICDKCVAGLPTVSNKPNVTGIFKQFTERYPNLRIIAITSENSGKADKTNILTIQLENGKVSNVLKNKNDAEEYYKK